jgi:hypothetical protein
MVMHAGMFSRSHAWTRPELMNTNACKRLGSEISAWVLREAEEPMQGASISELGMSKLENILASKLFWRSNAGHVHAVCSFAYQHFNTTGTVYT